MRKGFSEKSAQYRAVVKDRKALRERGMSRFEVRGLERDKKLIRDLAKRLAANDEKARRLRDELLKGAPPEGETRGGFLRWIRSSPLVGSGINLDREVVRLRKIEL
ncbi:MAG: hypothetical protein K8S25_01025 [Alphaproteobacteria bacterium]|nr:hypothetical protein [Alphaproteobacteria bacterium]